MYLDHNLFLNIISEISISWLWLIAALGFLLAEIAFPGLFFFVAFAAGACAASITSLISTDLQVQCIVAFIVGSLAFGMLRYFFASRQNPEGIKTNTEALVGELGIVINEISITSRGYVRLNAELWPAKEVHNKKIEAGRQVQVLRVEGNHLIVIEK